MAYPTIRKIRDERERQAVIAAAAADDDAMHFPTHVVIKEGEIAGGLCLAGIPLVLVWNHTDKIKVRDSMVINNTIEAIMDDRSPHGYFMACNDNSPYIGHMGKLGFTPVWPTNIFYKR